MTELISLHRRGSAWAGGDMGRGTPQRLWKLVPASHWTRKGQSPHPPPWRAACPRGRAPDPEISGGCRAAEMGQTRARVGDEDGLTPHASRGGTGTWGTCSPAGGLWQGSGRGPPRCWGPGVSPSENKGAGIPSETVRSTDHLLGAENQQLCSVTLGTRRWGGASPHGLSPSVMSESVLRQFWGCRGVGLREREREKEREKH